MTKSRKQSQLHSRAVPARGRLAYAPAAHGQHPGDCTQTRLNRAGGPHEVQERSMQTQRRRNERITGTQKQTDRPARDGQSYGRPLVLVVDVGLRACAKHHMIGTSLRQEPTQRHHKESHKTRPRLRRNTTDTGVEQRLDSFSVAVLGSDVQHRVALQEEVMALTTSTAYKHEERKRTRQPKTHKITRQKPIRLNRHLTIKQKLPHIMQHSPKNNCYTQRAPVCPWQRAGPSDQESASSQTATHTT